jgi:hypothetical protein
MQRDHMGIALSPPIAAHRKLLIIAPLYRIRKERLRLMTRILKPRPWEKAVSSKHCDKINTMHAGYEIASID